MRDDEREVQLFFVGSGRIFFVGSAFAHFVGSGGLRRPNPPQTYPPQRGGYPPGFSLDDFCIM